MFCHDFFKLREKNRAKTGSIFLDTRGFTPGY